MKKNIIVFLVLLCLIPIALADLKVDDIKINVNDETISGADEGGGDINVKRGDTLTIKSFFDNEMNNKSYVRLKGELKYIDDGDTITIWKPSSSEWYDLDANEEISKSVYFTIPGDADYDEYDLDFFVFYKYENGTNFEIDYYWDVIVKKDEEDEQTLDEQLDELKLLINNISCSSETDENTYYSLYHECFTNLTTCEGYKTTNEGYKTNYDVCVLARDTYSQQNYQCNADYKYLNNTYNYCVVDRDNYAGQRWMWGFIASIALIIFYFIWFRYIPSRKKTGNVGTKETPPSMNTYPTIEEMIAQGKTKSIPLAIPPQTPPTPPIS